MESEEVPERLGELCLRQGFKLARLLDEQGATNFRALTPELERTVSLQTSFLRQNNTSSTIPMV